MYVLVRTDLSFPQITVQAAHAAIEATRAFLTSEVEHPHLIICGVRNEPELLKEVNRLDKLGVRVKIFYEADRNDEATALATEIIYNEGRALFKKYRLLN